MTESVLDETSSSGIFCVTFFLENNGKCFDCIYILNIVKWLIVWIKFKTLYWVFSKLSTRFEQDSNVAQTLLNVYHFTLLWNIRTIKVTVFAISFRSVANNWSWKKRQQWTSDKGKRISRWTKLYQWITPITNPPCQDNIRFLISAKEKCQATWLIASDVRWRDCIIMISSTLEVSI